MKKTVLASVVFLAAMPCFAKEVNEINEKFICSIDGNKNNSKAAVEEIAVEVRKINFNKDTTQKPSWGSVSNTKVKIGTATHEATMLVNQKGKVALSYVLMADEKNKTSIAQIYEINLAKMRLKKTSLSLFDEGNHSVSSIEMSCSRVV